MASEIRVLLYLPTAAEGGRRTPIRSGYRAGVFLHPATSPEGNDGILTIEEGQWSSPGEECLVRIRFLHPELVPHNLSVDQRIELREGARVVGKGVIVEVVDRKPV